MPKSMFTPAYRGVTDALAALRRDAGVTQRELSLRLGKPQAWVSNVERGSRRIDVVEFFAIVAALGADPVEVFTQVASSWPPDLSI
ncbi:MAG: helix-turn-helix domain-containing protein [Mycobacteriales bacterium]